MAQRPRLRGVSHAVAFVFSCAVGALFVTYAPAGTRLGAAVFAVTASVMLGTSALYHRVTWPPSRRLWMRRADHAAIFLLIAGTYTPIALLAMSGTEQVLTLSAVWLVATAGIVFEWMPIPAPRGYVTTVYMCLGWIGAFAFVPLYETTGWWGVVLVAGGGICYMIGAIVHAARRPDPWPAMFGYHEIFHLFVIVAALLHYCAIAFLVLPLD